MKTKFLRVFSSSILVAFLVAAIPLGSVYAQLGVSSIQPSSIVSGTATVITVQGTDFVDGASVVLLDGYGALATSFQNETVLTAVVPADVPAGTYNVTVSTGTETITVSGGLTIVPPTPVPPTSTPTSTPEPAPFNRPQFVVRSTKVNGTIQTSGNITLKVVIENVGQATAYSAQAAYTSADLVPTKNGGVIALGNVPFDDEKDVSQTFYVSAQTYGLGVIVADLTVTYYDASGSSFVDKFTLSIPVGGGTYSGVAAATATPTGVKSSQLVIQSYSTDVDPLQPGAQFALKLNAVNVGNAKAQRITMIVGGGSGGSSGGTPQPDGVSGGSGDFANFAPVGASNVQSLGDLGPLETIDVNQNLIVNVNTAPGAYPVKITFSYLNDKNEVVNDEQVITLLVYSLPNVDVSFYRPPDPFFVGQPGALPIQVVNLGKRSAVLGTMKLSASNGSIENGTSLIGSLEAGGYFTLDSFFTPEQVGPQSLDVVIEYTDDFNQSRTITKKLEIEVMEEFVEEPLPDDGSGGGGGGDFVPYAEEETTLHKVFRFIKGLFGLDSSWPVWQSPGGGGGGGGGDVENAVPVKSGGGGKG